MNNNGYDTNDVMELRAALIQLAKTYEIQRSCILRVVRVLEKNLGIETGKGNSGKNTTERNETTYAGYTITAPPDTS